MLIKLWNNQKGFTLVEMVIVIAIGLLILSGAFITFSKHDKLIKDQNADTDIRGQGRITINRMSEEIRNAGAGIPLKAQFVTATGTQLQYLTNAKDGPTAVATNVSISDTDIVLTSDQDFAVNQTVVIYDIDALATSSTNYELGFNVDAVDTGTDTLTLDSGVAAAYNAFDTLVNPYDTYTFDYDSVNDKITRTINGSASTFMTDVTAMTFVYKDTNDNSLGDPVAAGDLENIRKIEITLDLQDPNKSSANISLRTDVFIRNTG